MTLVQSLIPITVAVYLGFFFLYGGEVFDTDWSDVDSFLDFVNAVGDLAQFVTLGGLSGVLPVAVQGVLLLSLGLGWFLVAVGIGRGTTVG